VIAIVEKTNVMMKKNGFINSILTMSGKRELTCFSSREP
jgi:hypothetical protein